MKDTTYKTFLQCQQRLELEQNARKSKEIVQKYQALISSSTSLHPFASSDDKQTVVRSGKNKNKIKDPFIDSDDEQKVKSSKRKKLIIKSKGSKPKNSKTKPKVETVLLVRKMCSKCTGSFTN